MIKTLGLGLGMTAFFAVYFEVLNHPVFPVTLMPHTAVDRFVGFRPWALPLYVSLWIYIPLAFVLLRTPRELRACGLAAAVLSVAGLGIFFFWPTAVPRLAIDFTSHPGFAWLKTVDAAGNACPSLHVAFAVFAAIRIDRILREMGAGAVFFLVNWLWCAGIVYSTLATGQHVALDALGGAALGAIVGVLRFTSRPAAAG